MIFSSPEYILLFLPLAYFGYFLLNHLRLALVAKAWLVAVSLAFYSYWSIAHLPLLLGSIFFNFSLGVSLAPGSVASIGRTAIKPQWLRRCILAFAVTSNLLLLGYYKYANFFLDNINHAFSLEIARPGIILPLGISFFTFTQIAYLVDSYQGKAREYSLTNYALFVTFFPHLIAGPILHHREMMSQFDSRWTLAIRYRHIFSGLFIFSIGLFKKVIIADAFALWANAGFDQPVELDFFTAWGASLSYTFQIYFDFSGYCDMAVGAALLFNIWLPINFNSPYKSLDIQDFWRRWHITLSRWLRDYLYIPLGGSRCSDRRIYLNLMATFVLGGLWHGASWMFVIWGGLHGLALVVHRLWQTRERRLPTVLAWLLTFGFVNVTWVFFRADTLDDALRVLRGMVDLGSLLHLPVSSIATERLAWGGWLVDELIVWLPSGLVANAPAFVCILLAFLLVALPNSQQWMFLPGQRMVKLAAGLSLFTLSIYATMSSTSTVFLYFNF